ncbi:hypothetical protein BC777_1967 [Yoonia maricola]|uniref:Tetratricopeptide repeat protein n=1 Tax=Yoonia maricola TaxID=420999 RepID=A0A2M8WQ85_9RHOB|nr:hypothetical protein [Yoonia maricola]PJI93099.1 hypothetical protein BC777_1967 [Yoonia maricola]
MSAPNASLLIPSDDTDHQTVALRGCIEGIDHASGAALSNFEQIAACDDYVAIAEDKVQPTYTRAVHLFENGITEAHQEQAYQDFTFVIDAGSTNPSAYANRALLNMRYRNAPDAALADMSAAIDLREDNPRASYFERRAAILLVLAWELKDEAHVHGALEDVRRAQALNPDSRRLTALKDTAADVLRRLHIDAGQDVQKG